MMLILRLLSKGGGPVQWMGPQRTSVRSFLHVLCLSPTFAQVTVKLIFEPFYDGSPWYRLIGMCLAR